MSSIRRWRLAPSPKSKLAGLLRDSIKLYQDTGNGPATQVVDYKDDKDNWTINYENVVIKQEDGKTVVVFPGSAEVPMPPSTHQSRCRLITL